MLVFFCFHFVHHCNFLFILLSVGNENFLTYIHIHCRDGSGLQLKLIENWWLLKTDFCGSTHNVNVHEINYHITWIYAFRDKNLNRNSIQFRARFGRLSLSSHINVWVHFCCSALQCAKITLDKIFVLCQVVCFSIWILKVFMR